ncbi:MAG: hypothetical protein GY841_20735, partial [FCB group bacterium]|nr:hypothetical protein [FCB group bacterium]
MIGWRSFCCFITIIFCASVLQAAELRLVDVLQGEDQDDQLGWYSDGIGDINGDGLGDFVVGQVRNPRSLFIYLGGANPFDFAPILTIYDYYNPKYIGDVDCDGVSDFFAVSPNGDTARLYLGLESLDQNDYLDFIVDTAADFDFSNYIVSWGGDNDSDGNMDFWIFRYYPRNDTLEAYSI